METSTPCPFDQTLLSVLAHIGDYGHIIVMKTIMNAPIYDMLADGTQRKAFLSYDQIHKQTGLHSRSLNSYLAFLINGHFVTSQYVTVEKKRFLIYGIHYKTTLKFVSEIFDKILKRVSQHKNAWYCKECAQTFDVADCINDKFEMSCPNSKHHHITNSTSMKAQQESVQQLVSKLHGLSNMELRKQYTIAPFSK